MKLGLLFGVIAVIVAGLWAQSVSITTSTTLAKCQAPASGTLIHCNVANDPSNPDGDYVSANGAAYFLVSKGSGGGVASVFGRTGAVTAAAGDYSYSQLSSPPTTVDCANWSITQNGHLTLSNCTIK